jgi:hypothetical protein
VLQCRRTSANTSTSANSSTHIQEAQYTYKSNISTTKLVHFVHTLYEHCLTIVVIYMYCSIPLCTHLIIDRGRPHLAIDRGRPRSILSSATTVDRGRFDWRSTVVDRGRLYGRPRSTAVRVAICTQLVFQRPGGVIRVTDP